MKSNSDLAHLIKGVIVQIGFPLLGLLVVAFSVPSWETRPNGLVLFAYTILTIFTSFAPIRTLNTTITINNALIFSGIILYGAWVGVWSALIEAIIIAILSRSHPVKSFASTGQILVTIFVVGLLKDWFITLSISPIVSDLILIAVYWSLNISLVAIGISYYFKSKWSETIQNLTRGTAVTYLLFMILSSMGVRLIHPYGYIALIALVTVLFTFNIVFRQYFHSLENLQNKVEENKRLNRSFLAALASSIDARDPYTHGHSFRVATWAKEIAMELGMPEKEIQEIYYGGILHDIGKIGIEDEILNKEGKLTVEEYNRIKEHPIIGHDILKQAGVFLELLPAIRWHHERIDGKGYPDGLQGTDIPIVARILAISDAFDAMVSDRPYRRGMPAAEAIQRLKDGRGTQFDEDLTNIFVKLLSKYGSEELSQIIRTHHTSNEVAATFNK